MTSLRRSAAALGAAAALSLVLAACAEDSTTTSTPNVEPAPTESVETGSGVPPASAEEVDEPFNDADVAFAQGMIPHHRQAVEMAEMVAGRTENPDVQQLAAEISAAQDPEIQTMTAFLEAWGAEVPLDDMAGMDHDGMDGMSEIDGMDGMSGMMSAEDMAELEAAAGGSFDRAFLEMMVVHHEGAVEMAQEQLAAGENPSALALAQEVIDAQQAEMQRMQDLLNNA